jgi:hypothetical protein
MKMVKSLLLGSAAGLVAMAGAQAADLPVKAKPVQYVKICSLYGAGFYYIPGTDTCIKIGGFVRAEQNWNAQGSFGPPLAPGTSSYTRSAQTEYTRTRFVTSFDVRSQTEYGTLRSYGRGGWQWTTGDYQIGGSQGASTGTTNGWAGAPIGSSSTTYFDRAFVQLAGFTFGKTQSFYDFYNTGAYSNQTSYLFMDTGGSGTPVAAYTATFGNGLSATISAEDVTEQELPIVGVTAQGGAAQITAGAATTAVLATAATNLPISNVGSTDFGTNAPSNGIPDIVGNLRIDQAWGSAQVMGALHDDRVGYMTGATAALTSNPSDAWGYAVGGGLSVNLPMLGKGDTVSVMANYCHGATRYCSSPAGGVRGSGSLFGERDGSTYAMGNVDDAYYNAGTAGAPGSLDLPNSYNIVGGIAHHWNAQWQSSLYGAYFNYAANSSAVDTLYCGSTPAGVAPGNGATATNSAVAGLGAGCRDFSAWQIGSRLLWNPVANLDVSLEVLYDKVNSAMKGAVLGNTSAGAPTVLTYGDVGEFRGLVRVQRNFWP